MSHLVENFDRAARIVRHGFAATMGKTFGGSRHPAARRKKPQALPVGRRLRECFIE